MIVGTTTLIGISTLTSEINFYTRLIRLKDKATGLALFTVLQVELACAKCKDEGKATDCVHLLHLVPRWQSSERHRRLKTVMQDRPDLIESELSGLAFDSLQQCFRPADIELMFSQEPPAPPLNEEIFVCVDPAGGGPQSDFSFVSFQRIKGQIMIVGMDTISTKEPTRQYRLLEEHINALRKNLYRSTSKITIYVERNLGFEVCRRVYKYDFFTSDSCLSSSLILSNSSSRTTTKFLFSNSSNPLLKLATYMSKSFLRASVPFF